jgi:hypothetical protein
MAPRHQSPRAAAEALIVLGVLVAGTAAAMHPYRERREVPVA